MHIHRILIAFLLGMGSLLQRREDLTLPEKEINGETIENEDGEKNSTAHLAVLSSSE